MIYEEIFKKITYYLWGGVVFWCGTSIPASAQAMPSSFLDNNIMILLIAIVVIGLIFLPTIIAFRKNHKNKWAIFLLNWFSFTVILWVVALVWAVKKPETIMIANNSSKIDDLKKLSELHRDGTLTDEEYNSQKERLLQ